MREITTHKVNGLNESLQVVAVDEPGQGNACHVYSIGTDELGTLAEFGFQDGPINEVGVNGISNEALLAIVRDRLEGFQSGPYSCESNQLALDGVIGAMESLHTRTKERIDRCVEGTHAI
jgi:hypothetical protein